MAKAIQIGRTTVQFTLRSDEKIELARGLYVATAGGVYLGSYKTEIEAMQAVYRERPDFSAAYGA